MKRFAAYRSARGQAMAEALLALAALAALFTAQAMLTRLQDLALQTEIGARQAAFALVQGVPESQLARRVDASLFHAPDHRWTRIDGVSMLPRANAVEAVWRRGQDDLLPAAARLGQGLGASREVAREFLPGPRGLVTGTVSAAPGLGPIDRAWPGLRAWRPRLSARVAILDGAGHARDDRDAQDRIAAAGSAWDGAARATARAAQVAPVLQRLDAPWRRPAVNLDWLGPWAGLVPDDLLGARP